MGINTCLSDSFAVLQAEEQGTSFGRIIVWGTYGWALSALVQGFVNQITFLPRLVPGLLLGTLLLAIDAVLVSLWRRNSDFKLDTIPSKAAQTLTSSSASLHREPSDYQPQNESALINLGMEVEANNNKVLRRHTKSPVKIMLENEQQELQQAEQQQQPTDSNVPTTASGSADDFSASSNVTLGVPETIQQSNVATANTAQKILTIDRHPTKFAPGAAVRRAREAEPPKCASFQLQLVMLTFILKRRLSLVRFLILFILSGFFMSMHWNYFFLFLEELHGNKFEIISAFSMIGQSVIGELPFFILSRKMIDYLGRSHTLSVSFISMAARFLLYAYFLPNVSAYLVIVADCFQGPNYGLFYVVMTEVGLEYSYCDDETIELLSSRGHIDGKDKRQVDSVRLLLKSTIQSVAFACYEGIGLGLGSIVGGFILVRFSFKLLWTAMAACALLVGLANTMIELASHDNETAGEERSDRREFAEASAKGLIERVASPIPLDPAPPDVYHDAKRPPATNGSDPTARGPPANERPCLCQLARKSAGGPVAPPAAVLSLTLRRPKRRPAPAAHRNRQTRLTLE